MICCHNFGLSFISELSVKRIKQVNEPGLKKHDLLKSPRNIWFTFLLYKKNFIILKLFIVVNTHSFRLSGMFE